MWNKITDIILRNRLILLIALAAITLLMGFLGSRIQLSYEFARVLPADDPTLIDYDNFKKMFGEDGSVMVIGVEDKNLFELQKFNDWHNLSSFIKNTEGIKEVMSVANLYELVRNDSLNKFDFLPLVSDSLTSQDQIDSLKNKIESLPFYDGLVYNKQTGVSLMAITFTDKDLNTKNRISIVNKIKFEAEKFSQKYGLKIYYSGMPYIRTAFMAKVSKEMYLFLALAVLVTSIILWLFFRSFSVVFFSTIAVTVGVIWSIGTIVIFNYKITLLSGLIPPLIMVIGVPNCVFLINKFQSEIIKHGNRFKAIYFMMNSMGGTLFLANVTTAIGFGVLYFTHSSLLVEFGVVAAINVITTYFITLILIPIILSFLPIPKHKQTKHLEAKNVNLILELITRIVKYHRKTVYTSVIIITLISLYGITKINVIGFIVDDLPQKDPIYTDLKFFESNFKGVLPFEIFIDTKKPNGVFSDNAKTLYKIKRLEKLMEEYPEFSRPLSIVEGLKFSYQAYKDGNPKFYILPAPSELQKLSQYNNTVKGSENKFSSFLDSTKQHTRVSYQIADVGSERIKQLVDELQPRVDSIFSPDDYAVKLSGHCLMFLKGNDYLLRNLFESLLIEILLITIVGFALFRSFRIILLSKLPCIIPLIITAGIMGYMGIRFKPSTILIFSIAFGISSDGTIYFLTRYRNELKKKRKNAEEAITSTIQEIGLSMIYTSVILFSGFAIFAASSFGGTVALGVLISITLLVAMFTNIVLLPSILLSIHNRALKKELLKKPLIDLTDNTGPK